MMLSDSMVGSSLMHHNRFVHFVLSPPPLGGQDGGMGISSSSHTSLQSTSFAVDIR